MGKKTGPSVDESGNPYDYIVVIDAGSKGSRAHLYRAKQYTGESQSLSFSASGDDSDSDDEDYDEKKGSTWADIDSIDDSTPRDYPLIELVRRKKVKPGIAEFANNPKKLGSKYVGKMLHDMEKYIPKDQITRTPVFLHATGGMRLLKPEDQEKILSEICTYIQKHSDFYLPDCQSHVNIISGEVEGLYSWIGLNYKYGMFDTTVEDKSTYGALDMGGVSSQMAFEPSNVKDEHVDYLFKVDLNYADPSDESRFNYKVFSESFLGGMSRAHTKYEEWLIQNNQLVDPCLPDGYIKTVTSKNGEKVDIQGSSDFTECLKSLYSVLNEVSIDKFCDPDAEMQTTSCLLSDSLPKMEFNVKKFVGINEFYSNLKEFLNYKDCYDRAQKFCSYSYTEILSSKEISEDNEPEKTSEICFKSAWIINVLHQGVGFPRYGIDEEDDTTSKQDQTASGTSTTPDFAVLEGFSWTLGRAVLYNFFETASRLHNETVPRIGYYEPSSQVFVPGGEAIGISPRPLYVQDYYGDEVPFTENDDDDDTHDDGNNDDWDDVEDHRLWGSLSFLIILFIVAYLLMGKTKRQNIVDAVKRMVGNRFKGGLYSPVEIDNEDLELGLQENELLDESVGEPIHQQDEEDQEGEPQRPATTREDSFEIQ